jgi:hypothetical protein
MVSCASGNVRASPLKKSRNWSRLRIFGCPKVLVCRKVRREQLIEARPVSLIDGLDERFDNCLIVLRSHGCANAA